MVIHDKTAQITYVNVNLLTRPLHILHVFSFSPLKNVSAKRAVFLSTTIFLIRNNPRRAHFNQLEFPLFLFIQIPVGTCQERNSLTCLGKRYAWRRSSSTRAVMTFQYR